MSRAEVDLQISVKKACNSDEVPPKRKHVRACIVYTWDHKNSRAFWNAVKIQPLQSDQVQLFKALIMIHKVLQEGHPNALKDAYRNKDFIASLATVFPSGGNSYGRLIQQYDRYILHKLDFHRANAGFNGTFEYEEYISLRATHDSNEGYDALLQLMELQDHIDSLQKMIFATIHQTPSNLCKVSALVPLIAESYGIYKFCISMLRALYSQLGSDDFLRDMIERFSQQHHMLVNFYTDCQGIKFLTSLVTIPRLSQRVPEIKSSETPSTQASVTPEPVSIPEAPASIPEAPTPVPTDNSAVQLLEQQRQMQLAAQAEQQRLFEEQQRQQQQQFLAEQQAMAQQAMAQQAMQAQHTQSQSRVSELEHDLLMFKKQYDNDQAMLTQYDARVKTLETEMYNMNNTAAQQVAAKDEQVRTLEEQIAAWTKKYETLAKLYSQLRQEHLNLLAKFKKIQQKINSAQESIAKKERFEKDLKAKNLEMADLIRERDRARLDVDRVRAQKDQDIERLSAEVRELTSRLTDSSKFIGKHEKAVQEESVLRNQLAEREMDLEIAQESLETALKELEKAKKSTESGKKSTSFFSNLVDVFLDNNIRRIQDSKHELGSPVQAGNMNATPEYVLSVIENASETATAFATVFNGFLADDALDDASYADIILSSANLTQSIHDLMLNVKGVVANVSVDEEEVVAQTYEILESAELFFQDLKSGALAALATPDDKIDRVIDCNFQLQTSLQILAKYIEAWTSLDLSKSGNLEDILDSEMAQTEKAVADAFSFLDKLLSDPSIKGADFSVHESLLEASKLVIDAVVSLIKAATESQREIVARSRGEQSPTEFYKKNSRWTEGLISASKAVAGASNVLIQTADGVVRNKNSHEQLIVASNEVAASTAQLVAASRVKATFSSQTQDSLEIASGRVSNSCRYLVGEVQKLRVEEDVGVDLSKLSVYEGKTVEMEQQVEILQLENKLAVARKRLGEIRKRGYRDVAIDDE